jgi:undecaprenyl diphosphate synthase
LVTKLWRRRKDAEPGEVGPLDSARIPLHIAIIMDGNGRWAQKRGLPRTLGHKAGAEVLREILTDAAEIGVKVLTAYAFSTENWRRPSEEVSFLMELFSTYLDNEVDRLVEKQVRLRFIGNRQRLGGELQRRIESAEQKTAQGTAIELNLAVDYGGRAEIVHAARSLAQDVLDKQLGIEEIDEANLAKRLFTGNQPDPDLLIRPGGDMRISNFLLWQLAYAELWVTDTLWPDFTPQHFRQAIFAYQQRERRFGGLKTSK